MRTLYLCYFGVREPLVQTQVLPYLRELVRGGLQVSLLTFEPELQRWPRAARDLQQRKLHAEGIEWQCRPYHKSPTVPATVWDIIAGASHAVRVARQRNIRVLHARAHVPLAMAMLARIAQVRIIFDVRGLIADEYADAGVWTPFSLPFRAVKALEQLGLRQADQLVVLTERMRAWTVAQGFAPADRIEVIPCCVDTARYDDDVPGRPSAEPWEVVYAGSTTGLYLLEEMARFVGVLREAGPAVFFRVLTSTPAGEVALTLRAAGLKEAEFEIGRAEPSAVPAILRRARLGLSFRKPTFSQIAASPTKIPEYLAAGLPVVCNAGIGDFDALVRRERVGVVLNGFQSESMAAAAVAVLSLCDEERIAERCRSVARREFDLHQVGGARYLRVYERLREQLSA